MNQNFYNELSRQSIADEPLPRSTALEILTSDHVELLPLLNAAFEVTYITLPDHLHDLKFIPRRLTFILYLLFKIRTVKKQNIILKIFLLF